MNGERNIQNSPSAMLHARADKRKKRSTGKGRSLTGHQFATTNSNRGFGYLGSQSYGGSQALGGQPR